MNCSGSVFTKLSGEISSPNYPNLYPESFCCEYHVVLEPDYRVVLNIRSGNFDVEPAKSEGNCPDSLRVGESKKTSSPELLVTFSCCFELKSFPCFCVFQGVYRCSASGKWVSEEMGTELPVCVPVCGIPSTPIQELQRIFGGTRAKPGNFPWQVLFQNPRGGGVLISDRWVLTVASLLDDSNSKPTMYAGVTNINQQVQKEEPIQLSEEEVFIHPNWTNLANPEARTNFDNDIALLRLTAPVKMGPKISPLCLPGGSPEYELEKGRLGYISGWGKTENRNRVYHLMKAQIPVVDMAQCRSVKPEPPADSITFQFTDNMVCAGDGTKDSCFGDSGGAYAIKDPHNDTQYYVGGLVSWGPRCGTYGLYTRVGRYRDWIIGTMSRYEEAEGSQE
ncbi:complement C1s subcomponent-like [Macrochelys suwanniensis]